MRTAAQTIGCGEGGGGRPGWTPLLTGDGSWTLVHPVHGEPCHSREGAWTESVERYARPCGLGEVPVGGTLRLLDVGTGLGLNLAAALAVLGERPARTLEATGLEADPAVLRAALELGRDLLEGDPAVLPPGLRRWWPPVLDALEQGLSQGRADVTVEFPAPEGTRGPSPGRLRLLLGDGRTTLGAATGSPGGGYEAIFLDAFSPGRAPELWEDAFLGSLARSLVPGGRLTTFTINRHVRATLAAAGLEVMDGPPVGKKRAGTLARRPLRGPAP